MKFQILALALIVAGSVNAAEKSPKVPAVTETVNGKAGSVTDDIAGAVKVPSVTFIEPKDGAVVTGPNVKVVFGVEGMKVAKVGTMDAGTGHHHLIIDGGPIKRGEVVPTDANHLHFGQGQTETTIQLPKGKHSLTMQFADGTHKSYGEMMSSTIHITVK
ncbi:MAG TPA: DUF4399 domain-containing protein [Bdellovibrionales bacterium]|jgi:hypothetical protein|nr:DUF4399 domain-containing protein [Bdellovibrionales bacterium]